MATKRRKYEKRADQNLNPLTFTWEDVFYIHNLNDGTIFYRKCNGYEMPWYNLCVKPNPFYQQCRHYCLACGSTYEKMLNLVKLYVSSYETPEDFYDMLRNLYDGGKLGRICLEQRDEWWDNYSRKSTESYDADIAEYIEIGKHSRYYTGPNLKVKYTEDKEECSIEGRWSEWFEGFIDKIMSFNGYTKREFYELLSDDCDIDIMNDIFANLRHIGCTGIKQMKQLNMYRWIDVLVPLVNEWTIYDEEDEIDCEE